MLRSLLILFLVLISVFSFGQNKNYTVFQAGWNAGLSNKGYKGTFNGYSFSFIFGKNFENKAYLGVGIGNENLKGHYIKNESSEQLNQKLSYNRQLFPFFIDGRLPLGQINESSKVGLLSNIGYAPDFGMRYDHGFMFKSGFYYAYDTGRSLNYVLSASYGYQQLRKNYYRKDFQHQHFNVSFGIWLK